MTEHDLHDIRYLQSGSPVQQLAYGTLVRSGVFNVLKDFNPVLTGTLPLDIFVHGSDLDISCETYDHCTFHNILQANFQRHQNFHLKRKLLDAIDTTICSFAIDDFVFEITGQPVSITEQMAFRHMLAEFRILQQRGKTFKEKIIELKKKGLKTEPAFAQLLGLKGDPYSALLTFAV
jgi:hypothetical protein